VTRRSKKGAKRADGGGGGDGDGDGDGGNGGGKHREKDREERSKYQEPSIALTDRGFQMQWFWGEFS